VDDLNYTLAATNPVYLDVDGNRQYNPRQIARSLLGRFDGDANACEN
jgi:hypothetical protein